MGIKNNPDTILQEGNVFKFNYPTLTGHELQIKEAGLCKRKC